MVSKRPTLDAPDAQIPRDSALGFLRENVGQYPHDVELWSREPLKTRLDNLLRGDREHFAEHMAVVGRIGQEQDVVYVVGSRQRSGLQRAIFMADVPGDVLHVWLIDGKTVTRFQESDRAVTLPSDVLTLLANVAER